MSEETLTVAKLLAMMEAMPPRETWATWQAVQRGTGWRVETPKEHFVVMHPMDWVLAEPRIRIEERRSGGSMFPVRPVALDMGADPEAERIRNLIVRKLIPESLPPFDFSQLIP